MLARASLCALVENGIKSILMSRGFQTECHFHIKQSTWSGLTPFKQRKMPMGETQGVMGIYAAWQGHIGHTLYYMPDHN